MRNFIKSSLNPQKFNFIEVGNEEIALQTALSHLPDIIIFDAVVSTKEDYSLISKLRLNKETAHIPIILLSAKLDDKTRIKGLKSGANACLSKPLNADELALYVENFCRLKKYIHEDYTNSLQKSKNGKQKAEDEFVSHIRKFIIDNIEMNNLNGDVVGKHVHMSRVHLHRKLKSLTGQSITEFVKKVRLKKAMEMIQERKWNVSEVSYKTGFSSISHFSRSFKQAYGIAPSEV
jgi:AraC-like DNA-binding protein